MENLKKELVNFNRYKSVESFNNANNVTSSTISIVKIDENVMDIYLGRTRLTHNSDFFLDEKIKLENLIDFLYEILIDNQGRIESYKKDIENLKNSNDSVKKDINERINKEIKALKIEDAHIFEILGTLQDLADINKTIISDNKIIKENNTKINKEILSIKEKIKYLTGVNVDSFESLEGANRRLTALEKADKEFQETLIDLKDELKIEDEKINEEISSIRKLVEDLSGIDAGKLEILEKVDDRLTKLENAKLKWIIL